MGCAVSNAATALASAAQPDSFAGRRNCDRRDGEDRALRRKDPSSRRQRDETHYVIFDEFGFDHIQITFNSEEGINDE